LKKGGEMAPLPRWTCLGLAVVAVVSSGCRRAPSTLELMLVGVTQQESHLIPEGASVQHDPGKGRNFDEVRIVGTTTVECQLTVMMLTRTGEVRRLLPAGDPELGDLVGPGTFRLRGGMSFDNLPSALRVFAVCGGPALRFSTMAGELRSAFVSAGGDDAGLREVTRVPGLPADVAQVSKLFRTRI
jgi:hypothetical protein